MYAILHFIGGQEEERNKGRGWGGGGGGWGVKLLSLNDYTNIQM